MYPVKFLLGIYIIDNDIECVLYVYSPINKTYTINK